MLVSNCSFGGCDSGIRVMITVIVVSTISAMVDVLTRAVVVEMVALMMVMAISVMAVMTVMINGVMVMAQVIVLVFVVQKTGVSVEDFVSYVNKWCEVGASLVGGCCRTTPNTIRAIYRTLSKNRSATASLES
ncbi:Selenocysteine methyltransferase [Vitis vinifera]|uniref:Selenocysteine methyltransferase n=1 Tax=Vitis vinifera TaxID=29760 RepID=A0A438KHK8_VITVI|nr:Selenocysteine methyltransferase [Vitis vinifera]